MNRKNIFKWRILLTINYIKTGILFVASMLWLFSPGFLAMLIPEGVAILGWVCLIGFYFNLKLLGDKNFIANRWFDQLKDERYELRYAILEEKNLVTKVGNIKILPFGFGKH